LKDWKPTLICKVSLSFGLSLTPLNPVSSSVWLYL
jgi:hypothetical protein